MRLLLTLTAAVLLFIGFYAIGGWAQHEIDHMEWVTPVEAGPAGPNNCFWGKDPETLKIMMFTGCPRIKK
jgi:hypothetical protein